MSNIKLTKLTTVVPLAEYSNAQMTWEGDDLDLSEVLAEAAKAAKRVGNTKVAEKLEGSTAGLVPMKYNDTTLLFDPATHTYYDEDNNQYTSGSMFAEKWFEGFNGGMISHQVSKSKGIPAKQIADGWDAKGEVSKHLGTTIHKAIETLQKYNELPNNTWLREVTEAFVEQFKGKEIFPEQFIACPQLMGCGVIDWLVRVKDKTVDLVDIKTIAEPFKKMPLTAEGKKNFPKLEGVAISQGYLQVNFYRELLECVGYKVRKMHIYCLNGENWVPHECPRIDLKEFL